MHISVKVILLLAVIGSNAAQDAPTETPAEVPTETPNSDNLEPVQDEPAVYNQGTPNLPFCTIPNRPKTAPWPITAQPRTISTITLVKYSFSNSKTKRTLKTASNQVSRRWTRTTTGGWTDGKWGSLCLTPWRTRSGSLISFVFYTYDTNKDGLISKAEFQKNYKLYMDMDPAKQGL